MSSAGVFQTPEAARGKILKRPWAFVAEWLYHYANGTEALRVLRFELHSAGRDEKTYRPIHPTPDGWRLGDPPGQLPLYGLPALAEATRVFVVEGEKCAALARSIGLTATTSAHGAPSPHKTDWMPLAACEVIILPDNDSAGRQYALDVATLLLKHVPAIRVKIVELPGIPEGGDIVDFVEARERLNDKQRAEWIDCFADEAPIFELDEDSIRAPIESEAARNESWQPVPLSQIGENGSVTWLWQGFLAVEHLTLFTGLWKAGKTTLLAYLLRECERGGDLAGDVEAASVLVVSEETAVLWERRRDRLRLKDHIHVVRRPFVCRPSLVQWCDFITRLTRLVEERGYGLVVFDTLAAFWPVEDENDSVKVMAALRPLLALAEAGTAVLLIHHPRKGDGTEGQASRGSGALPAFADIIIELRRYAPKSKTDRRRVLTSYGRFDETPPEVVIELDSDRYRTVGTRRNATQEDRQEVISGLLPSHGPGVTPEEVRGAWPVNGVPKPAKRTVDLDLKDGVAKGRWTESGAGKKGSAFRYWRENTIRASSYSIGARNESATSAADSRSPDIAHVRRKVTPD